MKINCVTIVKCDKNVSYRSGLIGVYGQDESMKHPGRVKNGESIVT